MRIEHEHMRGHFHIGALLLTVRAWPFTPPLIVELKQRCPLLKVVLLHPDFQHRIDAIYSEPRTWEEHQVFMSLKAARIRLAARPVQRTAFRNNSAATLYIGP